MENILTQYLYNPVIDSGSLTAVLTDDGYPADIDARVNLSGKDEYGVLHNATFIMKMALSDIGSTQVKAFDPQGKTPINTVEIYQSGNALDVFEPGGGSYYITISGQESVENIEFDLQE